MSAVPAVEIFAPSLLADLDAPLLDAIFHQAPVGITIASAPEVEILRVSDYGSTLLGRGRDTLEHIKADQHVQAYQVFDPHTGQIAASESLPLTRATTKGEIVQGEEWLVAAEDGRFVPIICNAGPIRDTNGKIIGGIITWADLSRQKQIEEELRKTIAERDAARAELNHRVKNHLALVVAMVRLEAKGRGDGAANLASAISAKILALANAYSALEGQPEHGAPAGELLTAVAAPLATPSVSIDVVAEAGLLIPAEQCAQIGIIVTEAICNALKHGYPDGRAGRITVSMASMHKGICLGIVNDGLPLPSAGLRKGRGSVVIASMVDQLGGTLEFSNTDTNSVVMTVQLEQ